VLGESCSGAGVQIHVDMDPDLSLVLGDPLRLRQIFLNLLSNAIRFTPRGGQVTVSRADVDGRAVISVSDTGVGMTPEQVRTARAPFRQVESVLSRSREGTGLGLPLVEKLVRLHNGTISFQSQIGAGTTITISLPLHEARLHSAA
jgi:signal transduction histidine kinase